MADELRERAWDWALLNVQIGAWPEKVDAIVKLLADFAAAERALAIEECAKIADEVEDYSLEYHNRVGAAVAGEVSELIRKLLTPLPTDGDPGDETR